ncbi:MAG: NAD(P)-dependent oxidoreductase [Actinomycetota bacterium]
MRCLVFFFINARSRGNPSRISYQAGGVATVRAPCITGGVGIESVQSVALRGSGQVHNQKLKEFQMANKPTVGWIGTGRMGYQLAKRLLDAGYDVAVYNRTRTKAEPLAEFGATIVDQPVQLAGRDIVFSMVSTSNDLKQVMLGEGGLLADPARAPKIIGDASTVSVEASETVRAAAEQRGVGFLATPVSGNPKVISVGKLTVAASGPRDVYEVARPLLETWGRGVTYVGEGEVARVVKIAHNVFLGVVVQSMAEITVLAEKAGVTRAAFLEFLNDSVMGSVFTQYKTPALVNLDFTPTFTNVLLQKDFDLGLAAGRELGVVMPLASITRDIVAREVGNGNVEQDFASLILTAANGSGLNIVSESAAVSDGLEAE